MINSKVTKIIVILTGLFFLVINVQAYEIDDSFDGFDQYVSKLNSYIAKEEINIDIYKIAENLKQGQGFSYNNFLEYILSAMFKQIKVALTSSVIIVILIIISSVIKNIQLDDKSEVIKLTNIVCFSSLCIVLIANFTNTLELFKNTCEISGYIMEIISPFLMSLLIINGAITTVGIIEPLILFISSFLSYVLLNIITPILVLSVVFAIIGNLNEKDGLLRLSKTLRKLSLWILGILLTLFLGMMAMETTISKDVDSLAIKTTTTAVSNFIPVVGKFFSDSFEAVVGATKVITKTGGIIGIITIIVTTFSPVIKIIGVCIIYSAVSILSQIIDSDEKIFKIIDDFSDVYKTMCGILIANSLIFIISIAIVLNLSSSIVK